jgi:hypothetical protein
MTLKLKNQKSRGLGDTVEKITKATGIHSFTSFLQSNGLIRNCGCNKRKEALNKAVPYKK